MCMHEILQDLFSIKCLLIYWCCVLIVLSFQSVKDFVCKVYLCIFLTNKQHLLLYFKSNAMTFRQF